MEGSCSGSGWTGPRGCRPYLQLVHQVRQSLLLGYLREGDQLPTVKDVAGDLAINPNTVVKAYRQLEHEGLEAGGPGQGTFITGPRARLRRGQPGAAPVIGALVTGPPRRG